MKNLSLIASLLTLAVVSRSASAQNCEGFRQGAEEHASVRYREQNRRGVITKDVRYAEVSWTPQLMLCDISAHELDQSVLLYRTDNTKQFMPINVAMRPDGQGSKWLFEVKPCLEYTFAIQVQGEKEARLELSTSNLGPATEEEISNSNFVPDSPTGFQKTVAAMSATLSWDESACAGAYSITYKEIGADDSDSKYVDLDTATNAEIKGLKPCTKYEVILSAYLNSQASVPAETGDTFSTKPRLDAAANMKTEVIKTTMDSAVVNLEVWSVPCIQEYQVTICPQDEDCREPESLTVDSSSGVSTILYKAENLIPCTDYSLQIQPLYPGTELEMKELTFRTDSPDPASLIVGDVSAIIQDSGDIMLDWMPVQCAARYNIYKRNEDTYQWDKIADTSDQEFAVDNIIPCTDYTFAVSAEIGVGKETEKSETKTLATDLEESRAFEAPNLLIPNSDNHVNVTWGHASCIQSYVLKFCKRGELDCENIDVTPNSYDKKAFHQLNNLEPCTQYSLEVIPVIPGREFTARVNDFTTTNGTPLPPANFEVVLYQDSKAHLTWNEVQCSTGYKVYHKTDDPTSYETTNDVVETMDTYEDVIPCTNYFYAVATVVDEQESEKTEWQSVYIPPRKSTPPLLKILTNEDDNVTLKLDLPDINGRCQADKYEFMYSANGGHEQSSYEEPNEKGEFVLSFKGASNPNFIVQARLRYANTENVWSELASSREPGPRSPISQTPTSSTLAGNALIPILVGVVVGAVIILIIIVLVVKRRGSRANYDAEKADNNGKASSGPEERQKLNEAHPDA